MGGAHETLPSLLIDSTLPQAPIEHVYKQCGCCAQQTDDIPPEAHTLGRMADSGTSSRRKQVRTYYPDIPLSEEDRSILQIDGTAHPDRTELKVSLALSVTSPASCSRSKRCVNPLLFAHVRVQ